MTRPVLLGGLFIGVLSSLPIVNAINNCCCLWVVAGGLLTTYLQQLGRSEQVDGSRAAMGGLLAGILGALLTGAFFFVMFQLSGGAFAETLRTVIEDLPQLSFEVRDQALRFLETANLPLLLTAVFLLPFGIFGMLGGLLGTVLFRAKTPPTVPS